MTGPHRDPTTGPKVNVALAQIRAGMPGKKKEQVAHMRELVRQAVAEGKERGAPVDIVVLGEIHDELVANAEPLPAIGAAEAEWPAGADTCSAMAAAARESNVWLLGGSIPEKDGDKLYNTATTYRKTHLFDLCLPKMTYKESDTFGAGDRLATFETPFGKFGLAICYDIRFAEIAMLAARKGCMAMFYPAAFNTHTGPLHWELLQRARALDNQIYVATCSQSRDPDAKYVVYGHSMAVSPMGEVLGSAAADEAIVHATFDPQAIADTRAGIPLISQRRWDLYPNIAEVEAAGKSK